MDFNGNLVVKGDSNFPAISLLADGSALGTNINATQGVITFANGFKIQWDTISSAANTTAEYALVEAYTGMQLFVYTSYASNISDGVNDSSINAKIPNEATGNKLSHIEITQNAEATESLAWISFGFDV